MLENGGNDPLIVDEGVDPAWAAEQAALGAFANAGQICVSVERIYCHAALADQFLAALDRGGPGRGRTGSVRSSTAGSATSVHEPGGRGAAAGARALTGGEVPDGPGAYYPPTVLIGCTPQMRVMREETFGPVAPVRVVADFDEALLEAVHDDYGLAATVLTSAMAHAQAAWRALPVGTVKVNAVFGGAPGGAAQPRRRQRTGFGYGPELLDEMTATKVVHVSAPPPDDHRRVTTRPRVGGVRAATGTGHDEWPDRHPLEDS